MHNCCIGGRRTIHRTKVMRSRLRRAAAGRLNHLRISWCKTAAGLCGGDNSAGIKGKRKSACVIPRSVPQNCLLLAGENSVEFLRNTDCNGGRKGAVADKLLG
ncbi:hypothetical protein T4D_10646 [Trichinella pseudospiralis]|uniref:Uncharacterized protein n=1 Tax=Trichinella pseudospiralis TaxID=6337 RepID=A0A0V1F4R9_TRIPS|nr:hypothetical protein T4D_10646 [Trichinella pseudospiralis]